MCMYISYINYICHGPPGLLGYYLSIKKNKQQLQKYPKLVLKRYKYLERRLNESVNVNRYLKQLVII